VARRLRGCVKNQAGGHGERVGEFSILASDGFTAPRSMALTWLRETPLASARSLSVMPRARLSARISAPMRSGRMPWISR
jgi:hypothetical protein